MVHSPAKLYDLINVQGLKNARNYMQTPLCRFALYAVRGLIDRVVVTPASAGLGHEIELIGEIAAMIGLVSGAERRQAGTVVPAGHDLFDYSVKVVAGVGFEPTTFRL